MPSLLHRLLAPPLYSERLTPAQWKSISLARAAMATIGIALDLGILATMRGDPDIDQEMLWFFAINNVAMLSFSLMTSVGALRFPSLRKLWIIAVSAVFETFTLGVWLQATGTVTSYFITIGLAVLVVYRMFLGYWIALVLTGSLLLFHCGAAALEIAGVLQPESLFVGDPSRVYAVTLYHGFALTSIASTYLLCFLGLNAVANKIHDKERALAEVRREVARVAEEVKHGRLTNTMLADEYALGEVLGRGGMGEIYMARRVSDDDQVAVKILHGHLVSDETCLERFRREAAAAERIPHRHTARILDVGSAPAQGLHFIVMEYLRGEDLAAHLRRRLLLTPAEIIPIAREIAAALDAAHAVGVVHRDLKPPNVFLVEAPSWGHSPTSEATVKLLDFGVSKILDSGDETLTHDGAVIGTIAYMPPEQALGGVGDIGPAADCFSFAAVLYRALTGRLPFQAGDLLTAIREIAHADPPPPSSLRPELNPDVDAVIAIGMAKRIEDRYPSASALVADLERAARGELADDTRRKARALAAVPAEAATMAAQL